MKIALLGYGKMGKAIEAFCNEHTSHQITKKVNSSNAEEFNTSFLNNVDIAIDFSQPELAKKYITGCVSAGVPVVSGTTGWHSDWDEVKQYVVQNNGALLYSSNFSIGVHLFWKVSEFAATLFNEHNDYFVHIEETHHIHKKDAPSGTAITTAETVMAHMTKYSGWTMDETNQDKLIPIEAKRIGEVPGTHCLTFANTIDEFSIQHKAYSRNGFVQGAVKAAEFLIDKQGVFGMEDLLTKKE